MAGGQESDFSWTHEKTFKLIFLFEKAPFLYNSRLLDYKDRNKRSDAIAKLARELETTVSEVTKKLRGLRSQYAREKSKEQYPHAGAMVDGEPYRSKWSYYPYLHFLDQFTIVKKSRTISPDADARSFDQQSYSSDSNENHYETYITASTDEFHGFLEELPPPPPTGVESSSAKRETEDDLDGVSETVEIEVACESPESDASPPPDKRKKHDKQETNLLEKALTLIERLSNGNADEEWSQDGDVLFGKYVTHELKRIENVHTKLLLKNKIQNLIFDAHCSSRSSTNATNGYHIRTPSQT